MNTTEISKEARGAWLLYRNSDAPTHDTISCLVYAERAFLAGFHAATAELRKDKERLDWLIARSVVRPCEVPCLELVVPGEAFATLELQAKVRAAIDAAKAELPRLR